MEASWLNVYRAILLIAALVGFILLYQTRNRLEKPGGKPLLLLVTASLLYIGVKLLVSFVRGTPTVFLITRLNIPAAALATVGFVLLVIEYTGIERTVSRRTVGLLLVEPVVVSSLVWIDLDYLWHPVAHDMRTLSGYTWELTTIAIANQLYMNILLILAAGVLLWFGIKSTAVFGRQSVVLLLGMTAPVLGNFAYYAGFVRFNPTPIMFVFSGIVLLGGMFWTDFLDLVPIGRSAVIHDLDAGVIIVDTDDRLIDTNDAANRIFDFGDVDSVVGQSIDDVFAAYPSFRGVYSGLTDAEGEPTTPVEIDGRHLDIEVIPLPPDGGVFLGRTIVLRDVTDRIRREQDLQRKNNQLERFANVISHDLRNPLNVASTRLELARDEHDSEHLDEISDAHERMVTLIDDLLTLAKEGDTVSEPVSVDLSELVETCWFNVETDSGTLRVEVDTEIRADPTRVRQLIENLFRNAIEHCGENVTVTVGELPDGFYVEDDGPGIPEETRKEVFEMGFGTGGGTGFGLNIVQQIATAHGWEIRITDGTDGGARFEFKSVDFVDE